MKSKNLQSKSNYTTPEQSKKVLELGLPANSADCYNVIDSDVYNKDDLRVRQNDYEISYSFFNNKHYNPCWSVGQIIEIYAIAMDSDFIEFDTYANSPCVLTELLEKFESSIDLLDFTRLYNYE